MSDFDKEAEREKLRKRFQEEEKKRESAEQMSELLLKGATMTNKHCSECGNPIFRMNGQEFCPNCQGKPEKNQGQEETQKQGEKNPIQTTGETTIKEMEDAKLSTQTEQPYSESGEGQTVEIADTDLEEGYKALVQALNTHAKHAASTSDPRKAKEHLEAANEAADTLGTLKQTQQ